MRDWIFDPRLRWALLASLLLHLAALGWTSRWIADSREPDIDRLKPVRVAAVALPAAPRIARIPRPAPPKARPPRPRARAAVRRPRVAPRRSKVVRLRAASPRPRPALRHAPARPTHRPIVARPPTRSPQRLASTGRVHAARRPTGRTPTAPPPAQPPGPPEEDVPDGPTDLGIVGGPDDATQTTDLTKGSLVATNTKVKGQIRAGMVRIKPYSGPGVVAVQTLTVPISAPPGTIYRLKVSGMVVDPSAHNVSFTPVSGSLTVVPTASALPPVEPPSLSGPVVAVGNLYAHRGTTVSIEIYIGDGLKQVCSVDIKVDFADVQVPPRRRRSASAAHGVP